MNWFDTEILEVIKETPDTVSIVLDAEDTFDWIPGQHIQIKLNIEGKERIRNYSVSSEINAPLQITVKTVKDGLVSKHINSHLKAGETVQISKANGHFRHLPNEQNRQSYYFFAAGSGITPIFCMLSHILATEPNSFVYLLYGNKDDKTTIFKQKLETLSQGYQQQFVVRDCHSSPSWFKTSPWQTGRIDAKVVSEFIKQNPPYAQNCQYFICGPGDFIPNITQALNDIDVPNSRIHTEYFGASNTKTKNQGAEARLSVNLYGQKHQVEISPGQTLLEAMKAASIEAPYSCESGVCGSCQCTIKEGTVEMNNNLVLQPDELKQGKILACQALPTSNTIKIDYG